MGTAYNYDKNKIKANLTGDQIFKLLEDLGGEPYWQEDNIISKTICHGGESHKLYYYCNTHLFRCYTDCGDDAFDIFELIKKIRKRELNQEDYPLQDAISFVINYFNISQIESDFKLVENNTPNLTTKVFQNYDRIKQINIEKQIVELKEYDDSFLKNLPAPAIIPWIKDGISQKIMEYYEIKYDPKNCGVVIPHRDIDGRLIGVRERTLVKEIAEQYGKYMPMRRNGQMYNHPLSLALYGLYQNKENIKKIKKAFIFESEKSVLQYGTMFGQENNIGVAICGSSFLNYQAWLLINLGVEEIIVGLDKQYQIINDDEHKKLVKNLKQIHLKYGKYVKISYLFDKEILLNYKDSPTDRGKEIFLELYKHKVNLY